MANFFTSDLHFGHANIIKYCNRPFTDVQEMNRVLINNWNAVVKPEDTVYLLGDVSFLPADRTDQVLMALNGKIHLIKGNHDKKSKLNWGRFATVSDILGLKIQEGNKSQYIVMCHYAMRTWEHQHHGAWALYGHSHSSLPELPELMSFDVGVDGHEYKPWSFAEVSAKMSLKYFKPTDHHGKDREGKGVLSPMAG